MIYILQLVWTWMLTNQTLAAGFVTSFILALGLWCTYRQVGLEARAQHTNLLMNLSVR